MKAIGIKWGDRGGRVVALLCALYLAYTDVGAAELPPVGEGGAVGRAMLLGAAATPLGDAAHIERVAALLDGSGLRGARVRCEDAAWKTMQPAATASIDFSALDAFVAAQQARGITDLLICLDTGAQAPARRGELGTRVVSPEAAELDAYASWVSAVVERYDGDGQADMPGLAQAVRLYEIGIEFAGQTASIEPYLFLLTRAYEAAHAAFPEVIVAHAAWLLATEPHVPSPTRLGLLSPDARSRLLAHHEHYDAINLQVVTDAVSLDVALADLAAEMAQRGFDKPVLLSHMAPSPLVAWGRATTCESELGDLGLVIPPARSADRCSLAAHFQGLLAGDPVALEWTRRFAAAELVRKSVIAASHGVMAVFAGPVEDARWWREPAFEAAAGVSAWSGLVDVQTQQRRPAHAALRQLAEVLDGRTQAVRVDMGQEDVRLYALSGPAGTVWVGWYDAPNIALPGQVAGSVEIEFDLGGRGLERIPMATLAPPPPAQIASAGDERRANIILTQEPVYLQPVGTTRR